MKTQTNSHCVSLLLAHVKQIGRLYYVPDSFSIGDISSSKREESYLQTRVMFGGMSLRIVVKPTYKPSRVLWNMQAAASLFMFMVQYWHSKTSPTRKKKEKTEKKNLECTTRRSDLHSTRVYSLGWKRLRNSSHAQDGTCMTMRSAVLDHISIGSSSSLSRKLMRIGFEFFERVVRVAGVM